MNDVPDMSDYPSIDVHRKRLSIDELSAVTGVSRRTVHYYVQRQLIDPPLGRGRGRHYDRRHALQILKVRDLQRRGVTLSAMAEGGPLTDATGSAAPGGLAAGAGASIKSVVRIQIDPNVTVELAGSLETITAELIDRLSAAVADVVAKHRSGA